MESSKIQKSAKQTFNALKNSIPIIIAVLLLIALFFSAVPKDFYTTFFTGNSFFDSLIGALFGSIVVGNPLNSYIIGGELLNQGISPIAVTAFVLSWVTVGVLQFPAESLMLGRKFAILRNVFSFITAVIIAILIFFTLSFL